MGRDMIDIVGRAHEDDYDLSIRVTNLGGSCNACRIHSQTIDKQIMAFFDMQTSTMGGLSRT